jgi:putative tryptophan/tyrosine transport system substrate-binding protein
MRRIGLAVVFTVAVTLGALATEAQPPAQPSGRLPMIGYLSAGERSGPLHEAFWQGLRDVGYDEGKNFILHYRFAEGSRERLAEFAAELVRLNVDVLVTSGGGLWAAQKVTSTIPVVFVGVSDPISQGFVKSLARPGGNMTGFAYSGIELNPKRLEILKETLPQATRFVAMATSAHNKHPQIVEQLEAAAKSLRVQLKIVDVGVPSPSAIDTALEKISRDRPHGLLILQHHEFNRERERIVGLAAKYRMPAMYELPTYTDAGGLMSYATDVVQQYRRAPIYVDRILKGAKPADLPVELPTRFELVINLKTAKALELTIPPSVLGRATQLIE